MALVTSNQYNLVPDINPFVQELMEGLGQRRQAKQEMMQQELKNTAAQLIQIRNMEGDIEKRRAIRQLAEAGYNKGQDIGVYNDLLAERDPDLLNTKIMQVITRATDADTQLKAFAQKQQADPLTDPGKARADFKRGLITEEDLQRLTAGQKTYQQGTGAMSGYVFDQNEGKYSITPEVKNYLQQLAEADAEKEGMLGAQDILKINDNVTKLTKGVTDIRNAAMELDALKGRGSPASKIAAIFKFMKANDPTSTVREGEFGLVVQAEGAMKAFAQRVNQLLGEGPLSEENFGDLVETAKVLANSGIETSTESVNAYLNVLADKIDPEDLSQLQARIPAPFGSGGSIPPPPGTMNTQDILNELRELENGQ